MNRNSCSACSMKTFGSVLHVCIRLAKFKRAPWIYVYNVLTKYHSWDTSTLKVKVYRIKLRDYETSWLCTCVLWRVQHSETDLRTGYPERVSIFLLSPWRTTLRQYIKICHDHFQFIWSAFSTANLLFYIYNRCYWNRVFSTRVFKLSRWNRKQKQAL
jgi:hypothetical protein